MKAIVFKVRKKVINPSPLRAMSLKALIREEQSIECLLKQVREANKAGFEALQAQRESFAKAALIKAREDLGVKDLNSAQFDAVVSKAFNEAPQIRVNQDYVVRKPLIDLLALRLTLCRVEIARCKMQRASR